MANTADEIQAIIRTSTAAGFRGQLIARGQARAMIWRNGILPDGAPTFAATLSYDLLSYGYSLLNLSIRLLDLGGDPTTARIGFEHAATAIESAMLNGDRDSSSLAFHLLLTACAYHLARFSARAYSILAPITESGNLSDAERCLAFLIIRDLDGLFITVRAWRETGRATDQSLEAALKAADDAQLDDTAENGDDEIPAVEATQLAIADNFISAMSTFLLALDRGDNELVDAAIQMLRAGLAASAELNFIPLWWTHRVAIYLLGDLWASSFYVNLPFPPVDQAGGQEWGRLRQLFIAQLYRRERAEIELWPSQLGAASRAVNLDDDLVVSLPTSAGKTRIAELAILRCLSSGKRVVFVTPLRALSAQTEVILQKTFNALGKSISALYGSIGSSDYEEDALRKRDIVVATPEKLDFALRNDPSLLDDVGLIVLDEGHMIGTGEREVRYEVQIQRLLRRPDAKQRRIVCLSAILPDGAELDDFVNWLTSDKPYGAVKSDRRPTRLRFGEVVANGADWRLNLRVGDERPWIAKFVTTKSAPLIKIKGKKQRKKAFPADQRELCLATAWQLVEDDQSVLIFCTLRKSVEPFADVIVDLLERKLLRSVLSCDESELAAALKIGEEWLGKHSSILKCLRFGVAVHHGALPSPFRKEVERLLREGVLKVTVSSPTLAQGLNLSASALVFHALTRFGKPIEISEFKNVIGRAGRAYVDVQGLILYPMFSEETDKRRHWEALIADTSTRGMESGLSRLVITLLLRMREKLGGKTEQLMEYVTNNAAVWDFPVLPTEKPEIRDNERRRWEQFLTSLDTAILSLVGQDDIPVDQLAARLDEVLSSSLWSRSLARRSEGYQALVKSTLLTRARFIWSRSTPVGRKSFFLAGVGLDTGLTLDRVAQPGADLLIRVNIAIMGAEQDEAIEAFTEIAELVFAIPPFVPDDLPTNWKAVLRTWLTGKPLAEVAAGNESEVLQFVEGALIYRLPWGMEAIRVRGLSTNDYQDTNGFNLGDFDLNVALPAIETGTLNRSAAILMQAGFTSRLAAIAVVEDTKASFTNARELRRWLASEEIQLLAEKADWPTPETASLWKSFRDSFATAKPKVWKHQVFELPVDTTKPYTIWPGQPLRIDGRW